MKNDPLVPSSTPGDSRQTNTLLPFIVPTLLLAILQYNEGPVTDTSELFRSLYLGKQAINQLTLFPNYPSSIGTLNSFAPIEASLGCIAIYSLTLLEHAFGYFSALTLVAWVRLLIICFGSYAIPEIAKNMRRDAAAGSAHSVSQVLAQLVFVLLAFRICPLSLAAVQFLFCPWILALITRDTRISRISIFFFSVLWTNLHFSAMVLPLALGVVLAYLLVSRVLQIARPSRALVSNLALASLAQCLHPRGGQQLYDLLIIYYSPLLSTVPELSDLLGLVSPYFRSYPELAAALPVFLAACYVLASPLTVDWMLLSLVGILLLLVTTLFPAPGIVACASVCGAIGKRTATPPIEAYKHSFANPVVCIFTFLVVATFLLVASSNRAQPIAFEALSWPPIKGSQLIENDSHVTFVQLPFSAEALLRGETVMLVDSPSLLLHSGPEFVTGSLYGDYLALVRLDDNWAEVLRRHNLQKAIVSADSPLGAILKEELHWQEVDQGPKLNKKELGQNITIQAVKLHAPDLDEKQAQSTAAIDIEHGL